MDVGTARGVDAAMTTWTSEHLAALERAIAKGARRVEYGDQAVTYHSVDEMLRLRNTMRSEIAAAASSGGGRIVYAGRRP